MDGSEFRRPECGRCAGPAPPFLPIEETCQLQELAVGDSNGPHQKAGENRRVALRLGRPRQFKDGKLCGQGTVVMPDAGYFGTFSDNTFTVDTSKQKDGDSGAGHG